MKVNLSGLPIPWPIALIGVFIALVGMIRHRKREHSIGKLVWITTIINLFRSIFALVASWNLVYVGDWINLEYPPLGLLLSSTILLNSWPLYVAQYERERTRRNIVTPTFHHLMILTWCVSVVYLIWQFISLHNYYNLFNFPRVAPFVVTGRSGIILNLNCNSRLLIGQCDYWDKICYFAPKWIWDAELGIRILAPFCAFPVITNWFINWRWKRWIKERSAWWTLTMKLIFCAVAFFFMLETALFLSQYESIVKNCGLTRWKDDASLAAFNSTLSHLTAWYQNELTPIKKFVFM